MKKTTIHRALLAVALLAVVAAVPASAQLPTFEAEIDCGDEWSPGQQVPFTVRFEEQGFIDHEIDTTVAITVPGRGQFDLFTGVVMLGPNQDLRFDRDLNLPAGAPLGDYQMSVTCDDGSEISFDTCSFKVR